MHDHKSILDYPIGLGNSQREIFSNAEVILAYTSQLAEYYYVLKSLHRAAPSLDPFSRWDISFTMAASLALKIPPPTFHDSVVFHNSIHTMKLPCGFPSHYMPIALGSHLYMVEECNGERSTSMNSTHCKGHTLG